MWTDGPLLALRCVPLRDPDEHARRPRPVGRLRTRGFRRRVLDSDLSGRFLHPCSTAHCCDACTRRGVELLSSGAAPRAPSSLPAGSSADGRLLRTASAAAPPCRDLSRASPLAQSMRLSMMMRRCGASSSGATPRAPSSLLAGLARPSRPLFPRRARVDLAHPPMRLCRTCAQYAHVQYMHGCAINMVLIGLSTASPPTAGPRRPRATHVTARSASADRSPVAAASAPPGRETQLT